MKKQFLVLAVASFSVLVSCNNTDKNNTQTTTDSIVTTTGTASTDVATPSVDNENMPVIYNLETKQPVSLQQDEKTHVYVDATTQQPISYYYEPISKDTFDMRGRLVNNALILNDGKYSLDDAKIKSNDNAFKIKTDEWKMKWGKDGDNKLKTDDIKIKDKGDKYKVKTDDTKIKIKDGEVKVKDK